MIKKRFVRKSLMFSAYALLLVRAGEYDQNLNVHAESLGEDIHTFEQVDSYETDNYHSIEEFIEKKGCSSDSDSFSIDGELRVITFSAQRFDEKASNPYTPISIGPSSFVASYGIWAILFSINIS